MHPWVRDAALPYWRSGHHQAAVEHAARALSKHTRDKTYNSRLGEGRLMEYAFGVEPAQAGMGARLRFPGDRSSSTWRSRMRGAQLLGQSCYSGIRNLLAHEYELPWSPQMCFQYLILFNVLASWIAECDIESPAPASPKRSSDV
ncbi:TIGR02391 family protein [Amycolatopsis thermoflava]|uniref:TIGR02391 family protein n=1 Tax=Amycolatopsis thermoflava TaxID=84480 RepID=UPI00365B0545